MLKELFLCCLAVGTVLAAVPQRGEPVAVLNRDLEKRIINGQNAAQGQFPWAGLLMAGGALCSCSLVRADWVLTAGHCVDHVTSGSVWFGNPHRGGAGEIHRNFVQRILHPHYNGGGSDDIAMLRLDQPYQLSGTIQTIALPDHQGQWFENQWGYIIGFGSIGGGQLPNIMQFASMRALPRGECNQQWPGQADFFICPFSGVSSACQGDSGGGFVIHDNGAWRVVGVASMVFMINGECAVSLASGYVRVAWHAGWIRSIMG